MELHDLPNIGLEVERQLYEVGITSKDELENVGAKEAWLRIQALDSSACIHRLYALEGAIQGVLKKDLDSGIKKDLRDFYEKHKLS